MEVIRETCNIKTSWMPNPGQKITDVVLYRFDEQDDSNNEGNQACSGGVTLSPPAEDAATDQSSVQSPLQCEIDIAAKESPVAQPIITAVDILCNARKAEVFTDDVGYLVTEDGICVDKELDIDEKLHLIQHSFEPGIKKCTFKLLQSVEVNKIWIQSIHISVEKTAKQSLPLELGVASSIDLDKVKDIMSDMGKEVPAGAKNLLENLERLQKNKTASLGALAQGAMPPGVGMGQMGMLMSMFTSMSQVQSTVTSGKTAVSESDVTDKRDADKDTASQSVPGDEGTDCTVQKDTSSDLLINTDSNEPSKNEKQLLSSPKREGEQTAQQEQGKVSSEVAEIVPAAHTEHEHAPGLSTIHDYMSNFETRLHKQIAEAEDRIMKRTLERLSAIEYRIQDKLDKMIDRLPGSATSASASRPRSRQSQTSAIKSLGTTSQRMEHTSNQPQEFKENQSSKPRHGRRGTRNPRPTVKEGQGDVQGHRVKDEYSSLPSQVPLSSLGEGSDARNALSDEASKSRNARRRGRQRKRLQERKKVDDGMPENDENLQSHMVSEDTAIYKQQATLKTTISAEL